MAEVKNSFISSKMNKDLDARLIPKNEYRDALNIAVSRSESGDVGSLESILGNSIVTSSSYDDAGEIIGHFVDDTNSLVYYFKTDWYNAGLAPTTALCQVLVYSSLNNTTNLLLQGYWLNFSTKNPVIGVNLIEDLLFWTDNRNQPRKINVETAIREGNSHYYKENHISVAKYNPYQPISLIKEEIADVTSIASTTVFDVPENTGIVAGMTVLGSNSTGSTIEPNEYIVVVSAGPSGVSGQTTVTISEAPLVAITTADTIYFLSSTMTDKSSVSTWPGDPDYLEDKFIRFAYRFKFEDNEYSIFSPFTQIAFIPKQKGYFIGGQEDTAVQSTIINWFENNVNNIELIIPLPDTITNIISSYKIKEIDILYKESDQMTVKAIDTIVLDGLTGDDNFYTYNYQSTKPIRTLPPGQTTRVYDKVPVKAMGQEIIGNRVVYSNFQTKHTPPTFINYNINVQTKLSSGSYTNFVEYPNHTVKQNRNYQVGIVLSDKFGRQSDVILSSGQGNGVDVGGTFFAGSTIYNEYIQDEPSGSGNIDAGDMPDGVIDWPGSSIVMVVNTPIASVKTENSAPGLYAQEAAKFDLLAGSTTTITDSTYTFTIDPNSANNVVPSVGQYLRGSAQDYVVVSGVYGAAPYVVTTNGRVNDLYEVDPANPVDTKFAYTINTLGWYSYKVVVKQTEQEYYNVYLPSAVAAGNFVGESTDTDKSVSYVTLINDNINKVPRDLTEVGPNQKQYRSSVKLFGRVNPVGSASGTFGNTQYYPFRSSDISTSMGNTNDLLSGIGTTVDDTAGIFQFESNPIVARISTEKEFGSPYDTFSIPTNELPSDRFQLAIYETEPFVSNIDIYWETASAGLVSDINWDIGVGFDGPVALENTAFEFFESNPEKGQSGHTELTGNFYPLNNTGTQMLTTQLGNYSVTNGDGTIVSNDFEINQVPLSAGSDPGSYFVQNLQPFVYEYDSFDRDVYTFEMEIVDPDPDSSWSSVVLSFEGRLSNITPSFVLPAPPSYTFDSTYTAGQTIHDFKNSSNNALNGSADANNDTVGFRWTILSGNGNGYFSLNQNTGVLSLTSAGTGAGSGSYPLSIQLCDAADNGVLDTDSICINKTVTIVNGYPQTNLGESSDDNIGDWSYDPNASNPNPSTFAYCHYMSDGTIPDDELPNYPNNLSSQLMYKNNTVTPVGILSQGEFGIQLESSIYFGGTETDTLQANLVIETYHRATPTDAWAAISDTNVSFNEPSLNVYGPLGNPPYQPYYTYFAQNTPGEYAFIINVDAFVAPVNTDEQNGEYYLSLFDLHYQGAGQTQRVYAYDIYTNNSVGWTSKPGTGGSCITNLPGVGPTARVYADTPFGEYVREFFTSFALDTVYTPPVGNRYYVAELRWEQVTPSTSDTANDYIYYGPPLSGSGQTKTNQTKQIVKLTAAGQKYEFPTETNAKRQLNANSVCNNGRADNRNTNLLQ